MTAAFLCLLPLLMAQQSEWQASKVKTIPYLRAVTSDFSTYMVYDSEGGKLRLHDWATDKATESIDWSSRWGRPWDCVFNDDLIAAFATTSARMSTNVGVATVLDRKTGEKQRTIESGPGGWSWVSYTSDGKYLVTVGYDGSGSYDWKCTTYSLKDRKAEPFTLKSLYGIFAHADQHIAVVRADKIVKVYAFKPDGPKETYSLKVENDSLYQKMALSADGKFLATIKRDAVPVYHVPTGKLRTKLDHPDTVLTAAFSKTGKLLATFDKDHIIRVWDIEQARSVLTMKDASVGWSGDRVPTLLFSNDDSMLLLWGQDRGLTTSKRFDMAEIWKIGAGTRK